MPAAAALLLNTTRPWHPRRAPEPHATATRNTLTRSYHACDNPHVTPMTEEVTTMPRIPDTILCEDCYSPDGNYVTPFGTRYMCSYCMGRGHVPNPMIDMRHLRDCIAAHGIAADLYMSGGNCATIGIGGIVPHTDDIHAFGGDYAYLVGVGTYHSGIAHREELGAGSDEYFHVANGADYPHDPYALCIDDNETAQHFAQRIATAYAQLSSTHPVTA